MTCLYKFICMEIDISAHDLIIHYAQRGKYLKGLFTEIETTTHKS